jgi:ElaB/YqjD/DUF883 family membrane-anchored ribosome-binding protein
MNKAMDVTQERLLEEFSAVVGETEQLLKSVALAGGEKGSALKAGLDERIALVSDRLATLRDDSMRQATAAAHAADDYVQDNPWQAVGIAAGVAAAAGVVVGLLLARR